MITHYEKDGSSIKVCVGEKSLTLADTMSMTEFEEQLQQWKTGTYIQDAFWMLTPGEREFMMTGTTPEEWEDMFGFFDEDDDEDLGFVELIEVEGDVPTVLAKAKQLEEA